MIELRDYQNKAVDELYDRFERMLKSSEQKTCVFKAPTGSGKTVVVAELLRKLVKEKKDNKLSFVWIAPRALHQQSKKNCVYLFEHAASLTACGRHGAHLLLWLLWLLLLLLLLVKS